MAMIEMRRGPEESIAADFALKGAFRQIGMRLTGGFAFDAGKFDPVAAHGLASPQHAAADLIGFDAFEQSAEIAFAEAFIALALDDLEEDRADRVLGEDLKQQASILVRRAVDQDAIALQARHILAMPLDAIVQPLVIGVRRVLERDAVLPEQLHRP